MFLFSRLIHHISCFSVRRKSWAPPKAPISSYLGSGRTHLWPTVYALVQLQQCHRLGAKSKLQPALPSGFRLSSELWILGSGFLPPTFTRYSVSIKRRVFRPEKKRKIGEDQQQLQSTWPTRWMPKAKSPKRWICNVFSIYEESEGDTSLIVLTVSICAGVTVFVLSL